MPLGVWLLALVGPAAKRILASLGFGIVSYAALDAALSSLLSNARSAWGGMGGDAAALIAMAGVNDAASILAGALTTRLALIALKKFELMR